MAVAKRKKKFFEVNIPLLGKETYLLAYELPELDGRFINYDLTRILRGKSMLIQLKVVVDEENHQATSIPTEMSVMPYFLRRMVRKGTDYVEDSFSAECKNHFLAIKPLFVTRRKVSRAVKKALREKAREELINYVKTKTSEIIFEEILKNKLQKELSLKLKKIYPLSLCEIRMIKVGKEIAHKESTEEKEIKE